MLRRKKGTTIKTQHEREEEKEGIQRERERERERENENVVNLESKGHHPMTGC